MAGNIESELKFVFAPEALPSVRAALGQAAESSPQRLRLISSYFDTQDDYLWRHGATLRLRQDGERRVQTLSGSVRRNLGANIGVDVSRGRRCTRAE
jgi:inorganic triphosphatase YgiF